MATNPAKDFRSLLVRVRRAEPVRVEVERVEPEHPQAREFLDYCARKREGAGLLSRAAVRPGDIRALLPDLFIAEPKDGDWMYRLAGTALSERSGTAFTGRRLRQIYAPETAEAAGRLYDSVARRGTPACVRGCYRDIRTKVAVFDAAHVPMLARDGRTVQIFGGVFFFR